MPQTSVWGKTYHHCLLTSYHWPMTEKTHKISVGSAGEITAVSSEPQKPAGDWQLIYAPGAGSNINDPFGRYLCAFLAERGMRATRFQFPYSEAKRGRPDVNAAIEQTWLAVIETLRVPKSKLVIGGRSMGGRIASQVAAKRAPIEALALFAYPLLPPGQDRLRDEHFPRISVPTLFCSGTRDAYATPQQLQKAAAKVSRSTIHPLEGADHGFAVLKSSRRSREDVWADAATAFWDWLKTLK